MTAPLRAAKASAVATTTLIGAASFVLSFAALQDLAGRAGIPHTLSWLWPVVVDGSILQATVSVIALAPVRAAGGSRRFFWFVLAAAAAVSVAGNATHAALTSSSNIAPLMAAAIATVAPISLLAATHGLALLVRAPVAPAVPGVVFQPAREQETAPDAWHEVAEQICNDDPTGRRNPDQVATILRLKHDDGWSHRRIGAHIGAHHSTVKRIIDAAGEHAPPGPSPEPEPTNVRPIHPKENDHGQRDLPAGS